MFAAIIFFTFTVSVGFALVSFLLTVIIEGFASVRADLAGELSSLFTNDFISC